VNVRAITPDDFAALAAFLADDETHLFGRPSRVGVADVTAWLAGPDLSRDSWLLEEDGSLVGVGWVEQHHDTGIAVGVVHRERRGRGLGSDEAFAGHWEHQPVSFEQWCERQVANPDHDPTLWFLVRAGEDVVAATRNDPERSGGGWIGALGVCPAWRGRGLAKALLLHSFREFHRRGERRVGLGVDSENATGATKLYESVGMSIDTEQVVWEKVLA
jgi:ribosomal protein S18 acetylase RimI-like enzyme